MIHPGKHLSSTTPTPKCMVCTTPSRCGAPALHTKGPRCIGRADGKDDCDCLNACGDDPWIESGRSMPCDHRRETQARIAALTQAAPTTPSPTAGMNIAQRILHVGGRNNAAGYVEFGSIQAVEALVRQVLRDLPTALQLPAMGPEPFGYVNTHTGQFFREVEQCRKNNQGHWRTVYTEAQAAPAAVAWRELCRRLYVELFYCNQQMTSGKRPKWQQGKTVRDVLADAKAALDAARQPSSAAQGDALDAARLDWLESQSQVNIERVRYLGADTSIYEVTSFNSTDYNGETLRKAIDAARAAQEGK